MLFQPTGEEIQVLEKSLPLRVKPTTEVLQHPHGPHLGVFLVRQNSEKLCISPRGVFSGKLLYFLNIPKPPPGIEGILGVRFP